MPQDKDCPETICIKEDPLGKYKEIHSRKSRPKFLQEADDEENEKEQSFYRSCPNNRQSLGFYTWNLLHTMAIYYPENPTEDEKQKMLQFYNIFAYFYPCKPCSAHFQKDIINSPPQVESSEKLSIWLCNQHNNVNKWLGKEMFDCDYENLQKRWKTGYEHCTSDQKLH
ncbi:hypothetical protein IMG5_043300 [Ichthyophthirius multifiliis]|uniref:Sulfhydryl oxidase n=1 Tax=Ichthyophthirius multifiliis TaxID=5932 RepID=G0QM42_ICHMU|nr:hypothetical protein IMG5_043300 [Ichthyophthirius multifiliis]EGR33714.1 hypothetical protein IMG5_043300 [Ichthyophthirius multifiliis]|eukprot:XP_004037700.1 hypothetical protein IMG5_043300 [Ichthyophthirius multifiliis]